MRQGVESRRQKVRLPIPIILNKIMIKLLAVCVQEFPDLRKVWVTGCEFYLENL
jgi:hypothetical protein